MLDRGKLKPGFDLCSLGGSNHHNAAGEIVGGRAVVGQGHIWFYDDAPANCFESVEQPPCEPEPGWRWDGKRPAKKGERIRYLGFYDSQCDTADPVWVEVPDRPEKPEDGCVWGEYRICVAGERLWDAAQKQFVTVIVTPTMHPHWTLTPVAKPEPKFKVGIYVRLKDGTHMVRRVVSWEEWIHIGPGKEKAAGPRYVYTINPDGSQNGSEEHAYETAPNTPGCYDKDCKPCPKDFDKGWPRYANAGLHDALVAYYRMTGPAACVLVRPDGTEKICFDTATRNIMSAIANGESVRKELTREQAEALVKPKPPALLPCRICGNIPMLAGCDSGPCWYYSRNNENQVEVVGPTRPTEPEARAAWNKLMK